MRRVASYLFSTDRNYPVSTPNIRRDLRIVVAALILIITGFGFTHAQSNDNPPVQVFLSPRDDGRDNLIFSNLLTGDERRLALAGSRYTMTDDGVMFFDRSSGRVRLALADGSLRDHPFVQPTADARRVDWAISTNRVAWTVTTGTDTALSTQTWVANADGINPRLIFSDGPRSGIRAYPVAFSSEGATLYMDYQPDTIGDITPLRQYAGLFALDVTTGDAVSLPGEPGCFCGAGFGGGWFLRLALAPGGFDLLMFNLARESTETRIAAMSYPDFTQGGGFLINPNGTQAAYALSKIGGLSSGASSGDQTVIVLVDLLNMTQRPTAPPFDGLLRPISWMEDGSGILLSDPRATATWKLEPATGSLNRIAVGMVLGTLGYNNPYG